MANILKETEEYRIRYPSDDNSKSWVGIEIWNQNLNKWIVISSVGWVGSQTEKEATTLAEDYFKKEGFFWIQQTTKSYSEMQARNKSDLASYKRYGSD